MGEKRNMELKSDIDSVNIKEVIEKHPEIGNILERYEIGCIKCSTGTCILKDVVAVHFLGDETEKMIEEEINSYLEGL